MEQYVYRAKKAEDALEEMKRQNARSDIQDLKDHRDQLVLKGRQGMQVKTDKCSMRHAIPQPEL